MNTLKSTCKKFLTWHNVLVMTNTLAYLLDNKIYINLTNKCTNSCIFCLRQDKDDVCGKNMWLESEDFSAQDVIDQIETTIQQFNLSTVQPFEITFCGYGEPMLKLDILKEVAKYLKEKHPEIKIRVNTNGHANYVFKRNVVPELKGLVDTFSVSLNGATKEEYDELSQPAFATAYDEVKKFIKASADEGFNTVATVVEGYKGRHIDLEKCEQISNELGAKFRAREWIENGYS